LKGVPIRLEIGPREMKKKEVTLVRRDSGKKKTVKESRLLEEVLLEGKALSNSLLKQADSLFQGNFHDSSSLQELKKLLGKGGFVRANFCTIKNSGKLCEDKVKEIASGQVRGVRADRAEKAKGKCIACGRKAGCKVYIARQY
jgi:prolyl-tRNA synthetase